MDKANEINFSQKPQNNSTITVIVIAEVEMEHDNPIFVIKDQKYYDNVPQAVNEEYFNKAIVEKYLNEKNSKNNRK